MNDRTPTGPALAERLGGTFDFDNATVRFEGHSYFVRCGATGKVQLVLDGQSAPVNLGRMSEPLDVLAREFEAALDARADDGLGTTDDDLPGMWSRSDFEGGDPDERSYAERERDDR